PPPPPPPPLFNATATPEIYTLQPSSAASDVYKRQPGSLTLCRRIPS
ncbi:hypothetical protein H8943_18665, partial [Bacillus pumilus]|nr:hypothetical protein [Bacillus pumilus]